VSYWFQSCRASPPWAGLPPSPPACPCASVLLLSPVCAGLSVHSRTDVRSTSLWMPSRNSTTEKPWAQREWPNQVASPSGTEKAAKAASLSACPFVRPFIHGPLLSLALALQGNAATEEPPGQGQDLASGSLSVILRSCQVFPQLGIRPAAGKPLA
jgi:hypothetical protein